MTTVNLTLSLPQCVQSLVLDARVQEVLDNGGFLYEGQNERGHDVYVYERVSRNGKPLATPARPYCLTALGAIAWGCSCPDAQRKAAEDTDQRQYCKHVHALGTMLMAPVLEQIAARQAAEREADVRARRLRMGWEAVLSPEPATDTAQVDTAPVLRRAA